ncbi:hypothetical protein [Neobacillus rhizophilus]|uniref:Uncharacterized protein n=1 Tax=Neobacillus rhizophilus TaxID=2833579 RepID=A0A942U3Q1_9BACI|nr:hypothetical protein [Neobacillus rhizophilus]MBS4214090.1 hypothetical protein [Neobacillus rhizophilus]
MHGEKLIQHGGITFETQAASGAMEFEGFGYIILLANKNYAFQTKYKISFWGIYPSNSYNYHKQRFRLRNLISEFLTSIGTIGILALALLLIIGVIRYGNYG